MAGSLAVVGPTPEPAAAASVVPTQWVARISTEAAGRAPSPADWNFWITHYTSQGCSKTSLAALGRASYKHADFVARYPEATGRAARVLALVRGVFGHEPNQNDWNAYYVPYANGTSWSQTVDAVFDDGIFAAYVLPGLCDPNTPRSSFEGPVPDVNALGGGTTSRSQAEIQGLLDTAHASCGTVALRPSEVVRVGGAPLTVPSCVTLTTSGSPNAGQYASMGRVVPNGLVCDAGPSCDHVELVRLGDGATLSNVWVDGKGSDRRDTRLALVGVASGTTATHVVDNRLSDPAPGGTALRLAGYGTTGTECRERTASRNLITGYATDHGQDGLGRALGADGISVFCEQATVSENHLVDVR